MDERVYWLGFSFFPGVGPLRFAKLLNHFGTAHDAWNAPKDELLASGLGEKLTAQFLDFRNTDPLTSCEERLKKNSVTYLILTDPTYPQQLAKIKNPPFVLYVKSLRPFDFNASTHKKTIGIVGTRKVTEYGRQVTEQFTEDLVHAGCTIVSGLALGVDSVAHKTTALMDGVTIAVLGCGVDCCNPRENTPIYSLILQKKGVIVSEFPPGQPPSIGSFPSRNRIIAGLSLGVLVTEGAEDSGSLITAADALKQGRKVFAVPGPITSSLSKGPNTLIGKGAMMVMSAGDILRELEFESIKSIRGTKGIKGDSQSEQKIIDVLIDQQLHFDELVRKTDMGSSELSGLLSVMEMKGMIQSFDAGYFGLTL